jgi:hypothetical protein
MYSDIWQSIVSGRYSSQSAELRGFQRVFIRNDLYPVLRRSSIRQSVAGVLYHDVDVRDLKKLDRFEGKFYQRRTVMVDFEENHAKQKKRVQVYLLKPQFRYLASYRSWTAEYFDGRFKRQFQSTYAVRQKY